MKNVFLLLIFLLLQVMVAVCPAQVLLSEAVESLYRLNFCGEEVPLKKQSVRERFEKQLLLTLQDRAQVILWIKRSGRYLPHIQGMLKKYRLPEDLKYVAIIESALRPHAVSKSNAVGFWQFTAGSAKNYGLRVDSEIDERRNIFKSTKAAIHYFKQLYQINGSWTLAAAAYNMGENGLETEILMQGESDYYKLYLPLETQNYVFRILCAKLILSNPKKFGFEPKLIRVYPEFEFDKVKFTSKHDIELKDIAQAAGTHFKQIKELNPEIRGYHLATGVSEVLVPKGAGKGFYRNLGQLEKQNRNNDRKVIYVIKSGDNLSTIADQFNVSVGALLIWNKMKSTEKLYPGNTLLIKP